MVSQSVIDWPLCIPEKVNAQVSLEVSVTVKTEPSDQSTLFAVVQVPSE